MRQIALKSLLGLRREPVGIAFLNTIPNDVPRINRSTPAGCAYWTLAASGQRFYTLPEDHFGCPIGAFVSGFELPPATTNELQATVQTMLALNYLRPEEPAILPHLKRSHRAILYAPLDAMPVAADVAMVIGPAKTLMHLIEAAYQIGLPADTVMGRPACGMIPQVCHTQRAVTNLGCVGNRVYTRIDDDELYFAFPGTKLSELHAALRTIQQANDALEKHHQDRLQAVRGMG